MDISAFKEKLLKALDSIDLDRLSLPDIHQVADIFKTIASIDDKSYLDMMSKLVDDMKTNHFPAPLTVGDLKAEEVNTDGV